MCVAFLIASRFIFQLSKLKFFPVTNKTYEKLEDLDGEPLTALVPVLMVLFGFVIRSIVIITALFAIWIIILFALAFTISEILAYLERRLGYCAAKR